MKSVVAALGGGNFPRVRIGVGAQPPEWDLADYVLENLSGDAEKTIKAAVDQAVKDITDGKIDFTQYFGDTVSGAESAAS